MPQLFVSDVHLDASTPAAIDQFLGFLEQHASRAAALYILGDLFEVWVGDDERDPQKRRICEGLTALTRQGVASFVIHGNRDFLLGREFCSQTGCRLLADPTVVELGGERVLLTHGDALCTDDRSYQQLRSSVRNPEWQRRFLSLPLEVRKEFAEQARAGSREHTARTIPDIMDVNPAAVETAFRVTGVSRIIHGHTHRPGMHELVVDGRTVQRLVLGAWYEHGSYLWYEAGRYELRELPREERAIA